MIPENYNPFADLLSMLNEEDLIRLRKRANMAGKLILEEILNDEIQERKIPES